MNRKLSYQVSTHYMMKSETYFFTKRIVYISKFTRTILFFGLVIVFWMTFL